MACNKNPDDSKNEHVHAYSVVAISPTCTEKGYTLYKCVGCGDTYTDKEVDIIAHTPVVDKAVESTCSKAGLTEGSHCSVCNTTIVEQKVTEKSEHVLSDEIIDQAATCFEDGTYHVECTLCHKIMLSATIKAEHNYTNTVVQPTALESGYTKYECTKCGDIYKDKFVDALGMIGLAYTLNEDGKSCTVTGLGGVAENQIAIPSSIDGYKVTAIGDKAFSECANLTKIILPDTITSIGRRVFYGCTGLTEIKIPSSVTFIGTQVFFKASNLSTVYYDSSYADSNNPILSLDHVKKIVFNGETVKQYMFVGNQNVEIVIGNSVTSIGNYAFSGCRGLTSVTIGNSVTSIGDGAFRWCSELTSVTIGNSVTSIGENAFLNCSELTSITIPDSVTSIGKDAFYYCSKLTSVIIPDSVTSIGTSAFSGCSELTSITIGNNVTSIGDDAFCWCSRLTSITIPDSVTSIGDGAFWGCSGLTSVTIGNNVTSIGDYAFLNCSGLQSITIPDSVTSIGTSAFDGCSKLTSVIIPDSVTSIGYSAFYCSSLKKVYFTGTAEEWKNVQIGSNNSPLTSATVYYSVPKRLQQ